MLLNVTDLLHKIWSTRSNPWTPRHVGSCVGCYCDGLCARDGSSCDGAESPSFEARQVRWMRRHAGKCTLVGNKGSLEFFSTSLFLLTNYHGYVRRILTKERNNSFREKCKDHSVWQQEMRNSGTRVFPTLAHGNSENEIRQRNRGSM